MKVQIDLDVDEMDKLTTDLNEALEDNKDDDEFGSAEILEILEEHGIEIN